MASKRTPKRVQQRQELIQEYGKKEFEYNYGMSPEENYKRLAKQADQRLVRLERLMKQEGYSDVSQYAYKRAIHDIQKKWSKDTATRFNRDMPTNTNQLIAKTNDILVFLNSLTSSKSGIDTLNRTQINAINNASSIKDYGLKLTWQDLKKLSDMGAFDKMRGSEKKYSSGSFFKAVGTFASDYQGVKAKLESVNPNLHIRKTISKPKTMEYVAKLITSGRVKITDILGEDAE